MCECDGQGGCSEWIVGMPGLWDIPEDERLAAIEASTTKFILTKDFVVEEPGLLAAAGVQKGDRIVSVGKYPIANPRNLKAITGWEFPAKTIKVGFVRGGVLIVNSMDVQGK
jgi:membrane-associated protease RseP (regulator of RpoE activity)